MINLRVEPKTGRGERKSGEGEQGVTYGFVKLDQAHLRLPKRPSKSGKGKVELTRPEMCIKSNAWGIITCWLRNRTAKRGGDGEREEDAGGGHLEINKDGRTGDSSVGTGSSLPFSGGEKKIKRELRFEGREY